MARCLVGCGSNIGKRRDYLDRAMELLRYMPGVSLVRVSRYRDTRPIGGPPGQGVFLNGACLLETDLAPHDVLGMLAAVENTLDRERGERWGPRTVDLDLLLYDDVVLDTASLTIPHPRMVTRRFVLEPCVEIAADLTHPLAGCTLAELLESISSPHPHVAVIGVPGAGAAEIAEAVAHATLARLVLAPPEYGVVFGGAAGRDAMPGDRAWRDAVEACAQPLLTKRWLADPHGTVADYWLDTVRLAAADSLTAELLGPFESFCARTAAATVSPQVAILLVASPDALEERLALAARQSSFPSGRPVESAGALALVRQSGIAECSGADTSVARLLRLQDRMIKAIRCPEPIDALRPRAVVTIAADDLGQAAQEAVAAVEAMA
jgi:2-amino-4-hydroxy-6-hydroxymethyldihydropteridine diphosphokinase